MNEQVAETIKNVLLSIAVADAVGVPVEFSSRTERRTDPVTGLRGYGTHHQPAGTFSDDSSLSFCLAESLVRSGATGINLDDLADRFVQWLFAGYWTANGHTFDVGLGTRASIKRLHTGCSPELAGGNRETECGNGALMRVMPLLFHPLFQQGSDSERQQLIHQVCSLTHRHFRSSLACYIYLQLADALLKGMKKEVAYAHICATIPASLSDDLMPELSYFSRVLSGGLHLLPEEDIESSGYAVHSLEAAIWLLLHSDTFAATVLAAVNLGNDTDTTAAIVAPLAVLSTPQVDNLPAEWLEVLARRNDIEDLAMRLAVAIQ